MRGGLEIANAQTSMPGQTRNSKTHHLREGSASMEFVDKASEDYDTTALLSQNKLRQLQPSFAKAQQ
ncbi:uncharacterized protein PHALS_15373 [Plasmopara halstedii]|uniref:Uncharacterized protein n=1 Tax=Plasmopara halstedii TaxID=4781 RepID=A0A0P1A5C9_PLAHL|nr:uncharacterized protein PHALS_15373 [Plasmopara halstedii]CEG35295.1 hypothetical protein PHALS_15373 [Plasmopara halstedii]|eukprot:XP_024571664.1 hypothetical protein PHALS_15373 [Plasmopara halstedii]